MKKLFQLLFMVTPTIALAQQTNSVEMADGLFASGKIYVVVASLAIVLLGLFAYLIYLDKKFSK